MARSRCNCGEFDCPECSLRHPWYDTAPKGKRKHYDDLTVEDVDVLPSILSEESGDEDEDDGSRGYGRDYGSTGC